MASSGGDGFGFDEQRLCGGGHGGLVMEEEGLIYGNATEVAGFRASGMCGSESSSTTTTSSSGGGPSASWRAESWDAGEAATEQKGWASSFISGCLPENGDGGRRPVGSKKARTESGGTLKVRKEKLSERITALQQLVSPFGKTDTASVLHEAMGYIKFLHDQVQVLSSPYLQPIPSVHPKEALDGEGPNYDLRSRGLCLVPVSCTVHVASSNGADFWAPAMTRDRTNSSKDNLIL
ncbi:transcription factor bHLH113 [Nymphaea colorata]|nr:transcription factor bHLH113 [Nymphaea colorata]